MTTTLENAGPGPLTRTAELLIDGHPAPGSAQAVGLDPGRRASAASSFRTSLPTPGAHLLTVRLVGGDDSLPGDDEASVPVEVKDALPVLLVDGAPGLEPLSGATDFLHAALAPSGDDTPQVRGHHGHHAGDQLHASEAALKDQSVLVLANVDRLAPEQVAAVGRFLDLGGGLLIAPGDRTVADFWNNLGLAGQARATWKAGPAADRNGGRPSRPPGRSSGRSSLRSPKATRPRWPRPISSATGR